MKELDKISDYITQLENERAELNKQIDDLKLDIQTLKYLIKNNKTQCIPETDFRTEPIRTLATTVIDRVDVVHAKYQDLASTVDDVIENIHNNNLHCPDNLDIRDEDKIRRLYEAVSEAVAESKCTNVDPVNSEDEVIALRNYIMRLGLAVDWKYTNDYDEWTDEHLNELVAIVEGNHIARKNLDMMSFEIESITREIQNDNFGLYRTFTSEHLSLDDYKFSSVRELAETIQKKSDKFVQACEHLEIAMGNLKATQLCFLNKAIDDCKEQAHVWREKSGALRCVKNRPHGPVM